MCPETVGNIEENETKSFNPILSKQHEDVAKMQASLLSCTDNPETAVKSIQQITVLRVYHQVARIVRYLEMMDKIEEKLYDAIDFTLKSTPTNSVATMMMLLNIQERLQRNIIDSHKLLQPYISLDDSLEMLAPITSTKTPELPGTSSILPKDSRDRIRNIAQGIIDELKSREPAVIDVEVVEGNFDV